MSNERKSTKDPFIEARIESALRPYVGIAPPALLLAMRESLESALTTHPFATRLIRQLSDHAAPKVSGEDVPRDGAQEEKKSSGEEGK
jgi:hypothetical protein